MLPPIGIGSKVKVRFNSFFDFPKYKDVEIIDTTDISICTMAPMVDHYIAIDNRGKIYMIYFSGSNNSFGICRNDPKSILYSRDKG
jgi:hypothetical protein